MSEFLDFCSTLRKIRRRVEHHLSERGRFGQKKGLLLSRLCALIIQAMDFPVLEMCLCWRGATSPASQISAETYFYSSSGSLCWGLSLFQQTGFHRVQHLSSRASCAASSASNYTTISPTGNCRQRSSMWSCSASGL